MTRRRPSITPEPDLVVLLPSWELHLRAERKSPQTIKTYGDGVRRFLDWCDRSDHRPALTRKLVVAFTADLLDRGAEPTTVRSRQLALKRFAAWLVEEGELEANLIHDLRPPKLDVKVVQPLTDDQLRALIKACTGADLRSRRDTANVRIMLETGLRAGEVIGLTLADVDLPHGTLLVRRGKGGKGRVVPIGPQATQALDRYIRMRRGHRLTENEDLWLGDRGKGFNYDGLHNALGARATAAGIGGFTPHKLRHTAAHRWLAAGGSEGGLLAVAGWTRPDMLLRYTRAQASDRAAAEARTLNLGDL